MSDLKSSTKRNELKKEFNITEDNAILYEKKAERYDKNFYVNRKKIFNWIFAKINELLKDKIYLIIIITILGFIMASYISVYVYNSVSKI